MGAASCYAERVASITLRPEARDAILEGSPWVRQEEIARLEGAPALGDPIWVRDHHGDILGSGLYAPGARIPLRIMSRDPEERLDQGAIHRRIDRALALRASRFGLPREDEEALRLIHGEADELPGFFVDRFGEVAILRIVCPAMLRYKEILIGAIARTMPRGSLYGGAALGPAHASTQRSGARSNEATGGERFTLLRGEPRTKLSFIEGGARLELPLELLEASGFSLAHRPLRAEVAAASRDGTLLEIGAAGSLASLSALQRGARAAVAIEEAPLLAASIRAAAERASVGEALELIAQRTPRALKELHAEGRRFDSISLIPGSGRTQRSGRGTEAHPSNLASTLRLALRLLRDEGTLILGFPLGRASRLVSGAASENERGGSKPEPSLDELLMHAARMESRQALIVKRATAGPDFPSLIGFKEAPSVEALVAIIRRRRPQKQL